VLRKIDSDPKWFLEMLERVEGRISEKAFSKYRHEASGQFKKKRNQYLINSIQASYAAFENDVLTGRVQLNLNKVVQMINYLAASVSNLHKVKLMKMLWYSDNIHYKRNGVSISGLAYSAISTGAVPEGYELIVLLDGVELETVWYGDNIAYSFKPTPGFEIKELTQSELEAIDAIISDCENLKIDEIVKKIHDEKAYIYTNSNCFIPFTVTEKLTIE